MSTVNIHDAKTHFSKLVGAAESGETVVIARAGQPVAKLIGISAQKSPRRLDFLEGVISVPEDFDEMFADEILELFEG